jgi:hypothetical protein
MHRYGMSADQRSVDIDMADAFSYDLLERIS